MVDLKLEKNEGILLIATEAWRYFDDNELAVDTLYLTNQNLISVYEKSKGIFSKRETVIDKVPLTSIGIINDVVQVKKVKDDDYGESLQIIYDDGKKELLEFTESPKKEYQQWKVAISNAVLEYNGKENTDYQDKTIVQNVPAAEVNTTVTQNGDDVRFCSFCGIKLDSDARFCKSCGKLIERVCQSVTEEAYLNTFENKVISQNSITERQIVYEGNLHKCPNCGEILKSFVTNCPSCGHEIRETKLPTSIREFVAKIETIEKNRTTEDDEEQLSKIDIQKINLIRNFSVPNTKEDLLEFLTLAASNINENYGTLSDSQEAISHAWEAKFEQIYQKAVLCFGNCPEIQAIKKLYDVKSENIAKKNKRITRIKKTEDFLIYGIIVIYILVGLGVMGWLLWTNISDRQAIKEENARLEQITREIYQAVESENYDKARMMIVTLVYSGPSSNAGLEAKEYWDNVQKEMLDLLEREGIPSSSTENSKQLENTKSQ